MHDTLTPVSPKAERRAPSRLRRRRTDSRVAYLFLLPWFIGLVVLTAGPILASLYLSFTDFDLLTAPKWIGFENYQAFVDDPHFHNAIKVTSMYVVLSVPLAVVFALLVAVALVGKRRASGVYRASYYLPSLAGWQRRGDDLVACRSSARTAWSTRCWRSSASSGRAGCPRRTSRSTP